MELKALLEAILFVSDAPQTVEELATHCSQLGNESGQTMVRNVQQALQELEQQYTQAQYVFQLHQLAGGYQLLTKPAFAPYLKTVFQARDAKRLSKAVLETLSIIAYRQPTTRAEVDYVRGVASDYALQKLLDKQLIEPAGRAELPGKPLLYRTSRYFMDYFGLSSLDELPKLKDFTPYEETHPAPSAPQA